MSRLLLVDDNPSIHRIAESLLAPTDVELVCVDSAAEALDRIARGERFDVALVDTAMPGMDGWTLLTRLRAMEETARMPIALMAGVLDPVDPAKLAKAPIQGFLKKPIELRELGDRVKALLATPVPAGPSPFSTVPATPAQDLIKRAETALPEFRPEPVAAPVVEAPPVGESDDMTDLVLDFPGQEEDLLVLTAEDLWPEEPDHTLASVPALPEVHLELEELDLDSLQDLTGEPEPEAPPMVESHPEPVALPDPEPEPMPAPAPVLVVETVPPPTADEEDPLDTLAGLEELETLPADFDFPPPGPPVAEPVVPEPAAQAVAEPEDSFADLPAAATLLELGGTAAAAGLALHGTSHESLQEVVGEAQEPTPAPEEPKAEVVAPEVGPPAAGGQVPAVPGPLVPAPANADQARAVVQAILADPVLVDALVKAVVARMGDQVLREIAWEVMPDLAGRLQR